MAKNTSQNDNFQGPDFRQEAKADYENVYNLIKENDGDIWRHYVLFIAQIDRSDDAPRSAWLVHQLVTKYQKPDMNKKVFFSDGITILTSWWGEHSKKDV
jgi:hypothetical protein